ncbi:histidinol-phosphate transaminase [Nafulsella turpanensis]|uniref:histidinol-phosphate transaminase n=1 Tax=Nafulsella turpanensis TaxID=1265690 RepID=UPI0003499D6B|nr:histidinol-phosphate transaminase [Nafulsella turpanensis]
MAELLQLLRPHLQKLVPYSSARDEFSGEAAVFLDANENPLGSATLENYNRYPDPYQYRVKRMLAKIKCVEQEQTFLGNGSDEAIDLLIRAFCEPGQDHIIILPPTYGMYKVSADINNVEVRELLLSSDFQPRVEAILEAANAQSKILFICSPNNPTANLQNPEAVRLLLQSFPGLVVVDEAYIDFARVNSWTEKLEEFPNLVVLQTFSKAWGLAALRLGIAMASPEIIAILNKIKPPYNINELTQERALNAMRNFDKMEMHVKLILHERERLVKALEDLALVEKVYPSDANFVLLKVKGARQVYEYLVKQGIIVRDRSKVALCEDCLRITVGTPEENDLLLEQLALYSA